MYPSSQNGSLDPQGRRPTVDFILVTAEIERWRRDLGDCSSVAVNAAVFRNRRCFPCSFQTVFQTASLSLSPSRRAFLRPSLSFVDIVAIIGIITEIMAGSLPRLSFKFKTDLFSLLVSEFSSIRCTKTSVRYPDHCSSSTTGNCACHGVRLSLGARVEEIRKSITYSVEGVMSSANPQDSTLQSC